MKINSTALFPSVQKGKENLEHESTPRKYFWLCTALALNIHPAYIEGRLGVVITALLTLVALQLTSASSLPEVDYMMMTDRVYLLSYLFIIATLAQVVRHSRAVHEKSFDLIARQDIRMRNIFCALMLVGLVLVVATACS